MVSRRPESMEGGIGGVLTVRPSLCRVRRSRNRNAKLADRGKHFQPVPKRNSEIFKVLIGQLRENREINTVFGKAPAVLGHAELLEPVRNVLHRGRTLAVWTA